MTTAARLRWSDMQVGDRLGPLRYTLTQEIIDGYARATEFAPPEELGRPVHPLITATDYSRMLADRYAPLGSGLHISHRTEMLEPFDADAVVITEGRVVDLFEKKGRDHWTITYDATSEAGRPFARHHMTATVDRPDQEQPKAPTAGGGRTSPGAAAAQPDRGPASSNPELAVVDAFTRSFTLDKQIEFARQYTVRMGDSYRPERNTHSDREYARQLGLPDAVGHSHHYYAWFAELALRVYGSDWLRGGWVEAKFLKPVFPGDEVTVAAATPSGDAARPARLELTATSAAGVLISVGWAGVAEGPEGDR